MKQEMPRIPNSNYNLFKKGSKLILSAATFGVVAAGSFQGVNYVVDNYNKQNTTQSFPVSPPPTITTCLYLAEISSVLSNKCFVAFVR